jgi:hypothetical protein
MKVAEWVVGPCPKGGAPLSGEWDPTQRGAPQSQPLRPKVGHTSQGNWGLLGR